MMRWTRLRSSSSLFAKWWAHSTDGTRRRVHSPSWATSSIVTSLTAVRGSSEHTDPSYLRIYLAQLRRKLEPEPSRPRHLITEPGMGYRFRP